MPAEGDGERLQKVLATSGATAAGRVCEDLIADGRVTVNGEVAVLGRRIDADARRRRGRRPPRAGPTRASSTTC